MKATNYRTKSGKEIVIRLATEEDASALLTLKLEYLKNSNTLPFCNGEYHEDLARETRLIQKLQKEKNSVLLVAEYNNKLIGNIDITGNQRIKLLHTGGVGMGILEKWRGQGVGSALLDAVLEWSESNPLIKLLWLEVYDSNAAGRALYKKMGFKECGKINNFFNEDGTFIDKITMVRHLV